MGQYCAAVSLLAGERTSQDYLVISILDAISLCFGSGTLVSTTKQCKNLRDDYCDKHIIVLTFPPASSRTQLAEAAFHDAILCRAPLRSISCICMLEDEEVSVHPQKKSRAIR
jgi:hypothetical protein